MPAPEGQQRVNPAPPAKRLDGLGAAFENCKEIRKHTLNHQGLLKWLAPEKVGVITNKSLKLNAQVLEHVLQIWCPVAPDRKTVPVGALKLEATGLFLFGCGMFLEIRFQWSFSI